MIDMLVKSTFETLWMVGISSFCGFGFGVPLALLLWSLETKGILRCRWGYQILSFMINSLRSIPYVIFMVALIPLTRFLMGTSIGTNAAAFPLSLAAILLFTRMAEDIFRTLPKGLIEAGRVMGATSMHIVYHIVFRESLPALVSAITNLMVMLIGFSAMAGAVGGGGLGDLAIRYGYQRYDVQLLGVIVLILVLLVQCVQGIGGLIVRILSRGK